MSEIAKCPVCGGARDDSFPAYDAKRVWVCSNCEFTCPITHIHHVGAAMELAKSAVSMWTDEDAMDPEKEYLTAKLRVLEVFNG